MQPLPRGGQNSRLAFAATKFSLSSFLGLEECGSDFGRGFGRRIWQGEGEGVGRSGDLFFWRRFGKVKAEERMASPAYELSRALVKRLYAVGAGGRLQNLSSSSARGNFFSGQTFEDESGSQSKVPNVYSSESSTPQEYNAAPESDAASESNAAPKLFSSDSPAVSELPDIRGEQLNQDSPAVSELPDSGGGQLNQGSPAVTELPDSGGGQFNQVQAESLERRSRWASRNYVPRSTYSPRGVYKAILLGEVGQAPVQKILKSGRTVTVFSVGTGGIHNNRRPFDGETPEDFAERSYTQWHRIAVYQEKVGTLAMRLMRQGTQVYLEGNLETRVYNDPASGLVKRIREIAIRSNGRLLFMDKPEKPSEALVGENPLESLSGQSLSSIPLEKPLEHQV